MKKQNETRGETKMIEMEAVNMDDKMEEFMDK